MASEELSDPRLILFIIYGLFVILLAFCSGSHLACERGRCPFPWFRGREATIDIDSEESESDGVIYELMTSARKKEIDSLRENIFIRILGSFSLTLRKEDLLQRRRSIATNENDIDEGPDSDANEPNDTNNAELGDGLCAECTHISVPMAGVSIEGSSMDGKNFSRNESKKTREVPKFCAICLSEYDLDETVCWSSNSECTHVFHSECIIHWLVALGRRESKMGRFPDTLSERRLLKYQLECPCCRQAFILGSDAKEDV